MVPGQFVAKTYTEAFGRSPHDAEWNHALWWIKNHGGCTPNTLRAWAKSAYVSDEFLATYDDPEARLLTLYRGALNRDPDGSPTSGGFGYWLGVIRARGWTAAVDGILGSGEFNDVVVHATRNSACGSPLYPNYYFGQQRPMRMSEGPCGDAVCYREQDGLQKALYGAPAGGRVCLPQKGFIELTRPLEVPTGVTLATCGVPGPNSRRRYALMARIIRPYSTATDSFWQSAQPTVLLRQGARLDNVWVDGQRTEPGRRSTTTGTNLANESANVLAVFEVSASRTPTTTEVVNSRLDGTPSHQTIRLQPHLHTPPGKESSTDAVPCRGLPGTRGAEIRNNLVTVYGSEHRNLKNPYDKGADDPYEEGSSPWADGIFVRCEDALVTSNEIVDASDVGIILTKTYGGWTPQRSTVEYNRILNVGNSAYAALAADPFNQDSGQFGAFEGAEFRNNVIWTSPHTPFYTGLAVGTRIFQFLRRYCGQTICADWTTGTGASFTNNTTGGINPGNDPQLRTTVQSFIQINGMLGQTVLGNGGNFRPVDMSNHGTCPGVYGAALDNRRASLNERTQPGWSNGLDESSLAAMDGCLRGSPVE